MVTSALFKEFIKNSLKLLAVITAISEDDGNVTDAEKDAQIRFKL
jgi:hypothetical protein